MKHMNNIRRSTKALAVLIAGYITFYVSLLPGVGINTLIPLIVMIIWFKIRHSHTYTYREIGIISASYLILSICFPIVTYMTGASIISLKDKQAIASVWYPLFPVTYAEADSISRLPVLNIGFWHKHADNDKKRTGITQSADYFLLVDTEGKLGIYCPFSFISREKKLFEKRRCLQYHPSVLLPLRQSERSGILGKRAKIHTGHGGKRHGCFLRPQPDG